MKKASPTFGVVVALTVLTLFFSLSIRVAPAGAASLCDRFPSFSSTFPSCRETPPPPPAPPPAPPPTPPPAPSPTPPPETGNDSRRNVCDRYVSSERESPPESCDICPNVPDVQLTGECADNMCVDGGGFWNGSSCVDMCPNVPELQSSTPCADMQCVADGGTWSGTSCDMPPPPPIDLCPNVPGDQAEGLCADQQCIDNGGTWNGSSCLMPPPPPPTQCSDGIDNDSDGKIDFPADDGCSSANDSTESNSGGGGAGAGGGGGGGSI